MPGLRCRNHARKYFADFVLSELTVAYEQRVRDRFYWYINRLSAEEAKFLNIYGIYFTTISVRARHCNNGIINWPYLFEVVNSFNSAYFEEFNLSAPTTGFYAATYSVYDENHLQLYRNCVDAADADNQLFLRAHFPSSNWILIRNELVTEHCNPLSLTVGQITSKLDIGSIANK